MTNPDSILKSKNFTLLTKVCRVKTMVFPGVKYICETWTIKRSECQKMDAFELYWRRFLGPLDCKETKLIILKEINPEYSLEGLMWKLKFQYFGPLMQRAESLEKILMSQFFVSGGQSIGASASASVLPMNIQD